jgi:glycosyltransferase involved in cell wall biosynthesis
VHGSQVSAFATVIDVRESDACLETVNAPLVTVLTPVHNGEPHLAECIESVIRQTYDNWEYVIVDNCSTDRTPEIVQRFAQADSRIRYERHGEFVDVVASHNRSFRTAVGLGSVYCKVVGADDWLFPECLARMVGVAESAPAVGVVGSYRLAESRVDLVGIPYWQSIESGTEVVAQSLRVTVEGRLSVVGSPTSLLLRSALVRERDPFYDETMRHADTDAAYWALMRSDFGFVHQVLTFSREPPRSESTASYDLNAFRPDQLRMLIRYGPTTLSSADYREELHRQVDKYTDWYVRRRIKRWRQRDIWEFHRRAIALIVAEAAGDAEALRSLAVLRFLSRW